MWHAFRNAEYSRWKEYKESKNHDAVLDNFAVDRSTLILEMEGVENLVYEEGSNPPKPPDPKPQKDPSSSKSGKGVEHHDIACDAMHVDGLHAQ